MSLAIDVTQVRAVMLADGWHRIVDNSFSVGAYEYLQGGATLSADGRGAVGYRFKDEAGYVLCGPVTAIFASRSS